VFETKENSWCGKLTNDYQQRRYIGFRHVDFRDTESYVVHAGHGERILKSAEKYDCDETEDDELNFPKVRFKHSTYIGVRFCLSFYGQTSSWAAKRWSEKQKKYVYNGHAYTSERTAAQASDTLARLLMREDNELKLDLNFENNFTEVYPWSSFFIGVSYKPRLYAKWRARRWSFQQNKAVLSGTYRDQESAAHASDEIARNLILNGEKGHKLNFLGDDEYDKIRHSGHLTELSRSAKRKRSDFHVFESDEQPYEIYLEK